MTRPTIHEMRLYILNKYSGTKWHERVLKMKPNQIVAIYKNVKKREELEKNQVLPIFMSKTEEYHQIDIFEYMLSKNKEEKK